MRKDIGTSIQQISKSAFSPQTVLAVPPLAIRPMAPEAFVPRYSAAVSRTRVELVMSCVSSRRSNQLS